MAFFLGTAGAFLLTLGLSLIGRRLYVRAKRKKMDEQIEEALKSLEQMRSLQEHPGWKMLESAALAQIEARKNEVLLQPTVDAFAQEFMKGEIQGIQLFASIPRKLVEENKDILAVARKLEEEGA